MDTLYVGEVGVEIYFDVRDRGVSMDETLLTMTTRTVRLLRPQVYDYVTITGVPVVSTTDGLQKLKIETGNLSSLTLTGVGSFILSNLHLGEWTAEVELSDGTWVGRTNPIPIFTLKDRLLAAA